MSANIRRALSLILCLVMIFGVFSAAGEGTGVYGILSLKASASESLPYSIKNGEVTIASPNYYIDENGDAVIPEKIDGYNVTAIHGAFMSSILRTVFIPKTVTSIFNNIGEDSPQSSPDFYGGIFYNCPNLESVIVDENNPVYHSDGNCIIETETKTLVSGCVSSVIPDDGSVTKIKGLAFGAVGNLKSLFIPSAIESIAVSPFIDPAFLTNVEIESIAVSEDNPYYHSAGNCLIETATGRLVAGCKNSVIPDDGSVISIGDYAFTLVPDLENITIPDSVTVIGERAFSNCDNLKNIIVSDSVTEIGASAFAESHDLTGVSFGSGLRVLKDTDDKYDFFGMFCDSTKLEYITVSPDNTVYHSSGNCLIETESKKLLCGSNCSVIPDDGSVISIGKGAFYTCERLTSINIPDSVTEIEKNAFWDCSSLDTVFFGSGISHIGDHNFGLHSNTQWPNYISEVYYNGTREEWESVVIDDYNFALNYANIHFNDGTMSFADYTALDALIETIPEDLSVYTEDSVAVLNEVLGSIVRDLPAEEQATVDGYAESLSAAIDGLYFEPVASISTTKVIRGERATWTVIAPVNVMWLRFTCNYTTASGSSGTTALTLKYGTSNTGSTEFSVREENGNRIWTVSMPFTYPGTSASAIQNWRVEYKITGSPVWQTARIQSNAKRGAKAVGKEYSQEVLVAKTAEALKPVTPGYEKFTLLGSIADKEAGTFTVVTTDDVSKIRITYTNADTGKTKSLTYQATSSSIISHENHDGLTVWVVKFKFDSPAVDNLYTVSVRGPAWGEGKTASIM